MINAKAFILPAGIPQGWELVCEDAVEHPADGELGALIRNTNTGFYALHSAGTNRTFPKREGDRLAGITGPRGGYRPGAGRKPNEVPKVTWSVKVTEAEKQYLIEQLKQYREQ